MTQLLSHQLNQADIQQISQLKRHQLNQATIPLRFQQYNRLRNLLPNHQFNLSLFRPVNPSNTQVFSLRVNLLSTLPDSQLDNQLGNQLDNHHFNLKRNQASNRLIIQLDVHHIYHHCNLFYLQHLLPPRNQQCNQVRSLSWNLLINHLIILRQYQHFSLLIHPAFIQVSNLPNNLESSLHASLTLDHRSNH
jgi:hypothetical protein